jgi:transposase InsO family protein
MEEIYYNPREAGSFGGVQALARRSGKRQYTVRKFLQEQDTYTLHKPVRRRFPRRRTYAKGIDDLFQADLVDVSNISQHNDGYRYILTCIDVFSKMAWAIPLKSKSANEVTSAFEKILADRRCNMLQTDKGTEWLNSKFQSMLRNNGIKFYTSENEELKASVVERFNRTLKERMWRYFTYKNTRRFLDILPDLIHSYRHSYHRSIKMVPADVDKSVEDLVRRHLYPVKLKKKLKYKFSVGDKVRIAMQKVPFTKAYTGQWSEEIFVVKMCNPTLPVTYSIQDQAGEDIKGKFYEDELQKITKSDSEYIVEKILKTRKRGGIIEYFVKWRSYPDKFNSWVKDVRTK